MTMREGEVSVDRESSRTASSAGESIVGLDKNTCIV